MTKTILIIGGGHNGLVCATYLVKGGHYVTILEARSTLGGSIAQHQFAEGFSVNGLANVVHPINPKIAKDLGLKIPNASPVDTISLGANGRHLIIGEDTVRGDGLTDMDKDAYSTFKKEFRKYAKAFEPLTMNKPPRLKDMDNRDKFTLARLGWKLRFGLGAKSMKEFLRVGGINIYDVLNEIIDDPQLKGAISVDAVLGHHMGPRTPTTVLTYLNRLRGEIYGAAFLPEVQGGIIGELEKVAVRAGVNIKTDTVVDSIIVDGGNAKGVILKSGEVLSADIVVSNADAKTTFLDLVGASELDAMFTKRISTTRTNGTVAKLYFALDSLPEFIGLSSDQLKNRLLVATDMRYVEKAFNHAKYGEYSKEPVLEITFPSLADTSLAPEGHHVMSVSASFAPYTIKDGWDQKKSIFSENVLRLIEQYAPGISATVVADEILTPVDIEREFNVIGGHWHHGELTIDQSFMMRPIHGAAQYNTPIEGLFLCGAAAHPGGGVTGIPGHNAAKRILSMKGENDHVQSRF